MILNVELAEKSYDVIIERGAINRAKEEFNLDRKVLVITDDGVPKIYAETIKNQCKKGIIATVKQGEKSKSIEVYEKLLKKMLKEGFSRKDCVVAVGGGVVGDLAGFVASSYMRGVDFYNVPTTVLAQIDSSIGGKTALNLGGVKNVVGAFYQPKKVIIDADLLSTLEERQFNNGLAEGIKMSLTSDADLFNRFEKFSAREIIETIIIKSLIIKKNVVEQDEKEKSLRKILNFGHTIGHAIESLEEMKNLYHGECVAIGMIPMCEEEVRRRLINVLKKNGLYREIEIDWEEAKAILAHDKKASLDTVSAIFVKEAGTCEVVETDIDELIKIAKEGLKK